MEFTVTYFKYAGYNTYFRCTAMTSCPRFHTKMPQNIPHRYLNLVSYPKYDFTLKRLPSPNFCDKRHANMQNSEKRRFQYTHILSKSYILEV